MLDLKTGSVWREPTRYGVATKVIVTMIEGDVISVRRCDASGRILKGARRTVRKRSDFGKRYVPYRMFK